MEAGTAPAEERRLAPIELAGDPRRRLAARVLTLCGFVAIVALYFGGYGLPLPAHVALFVNQAAFLAPMVLSIGGAMVAYRRAQGTERRFWLLLALANALLASSEAYYATYMMFVDIRGPQPLSAFEVLNLSAAVVFFVLLMSMTRLANATLAGRLRVMLDLTGTTVVTIAVTYVAIAPLFDGFHISNPATRLLGAVYPVIGIGMLAGTLSNIVGLKASRWQPWEKLIAVSLGIFSAGLLLWPFAAVSTEPGSTAGLFDVLYLGGEYLLFVATLSRLGVPGESRLRPMPPPLVLGHSRRGPLRALVPLGLLAAAAVFALHANSMTGDDLGKTLSYATVMIVGLILVGRTALTTAENGTLFHTSVTDGLTRVYNHRYFHERLALELELAARYGDELAVAVMDLDDFSRVNNLQGHVVGDALLAEVALRLTTASRASDVVCRVGGDEFAIILPETPASEADAVCERLVAGMRHEWTPLGTPVTASVGLACYPHDAVEKEDLVRKADGAQYWAKYHGKNQVVRYDASVVESLDAEERIRRLEESSHLSTVRALAAAVDARDRATQHHSRNVARLAVSLARELALDVEKVKLIEIAAVLHDIGKIGISDEVLKKRGALTAEERAHIEEHPELGNRILASTTLHEILPWTMSHHERWDGAGYPQGLAGEDIPLEARILSICDAFDSMTSDRPYRRAMSRIEALQEIELCAGTQFDPALADAFVAMMKGRRATPSASD